MEISYTLDELLYAYIEDTGDKLVNKNVIGGMLKKTDIVVKRPKDSSCNLYFGYTRKCMIAETPTSAKSE